MKFENTRTKSMLWLSNELKELNAHILTGLDLIEQLGLQVESSGQAEGENETGLFSRVSAVTIAKAYRLLIGIYTLTTYGLAQESGALLRPLIETTELLVYFHTEPSRAIQVPDETLPSPGKIASIVQGKFKKLREHLNVAASHFRFDVHSVPHLYEPNRFKLKMVPTHSIDVLENNLKTLLVFEIFMIREAFVCASKSGEAWKEYVENGAKWEETAIKLSEPKPK